MCHKTPDGCPEDERIEICEMEFPVPTERAGFYKDKSAKLAAGMQKALERDPRFCMLLDADDRVHADLVGYMAQQQDLLHIVDKGFIYNGSSVLRAHLGDFHKICGSVKLVPLTLMQEEDTPFLWGHDVIVDRAKERRLPFENIALPAVIKNVAYGENWTETKFIKSETFRRTLRKILRLRPLTPQLKAAFALDKIA